MRIAVDAMGGDFAPTAIVHGCVEAARISEDRYEVVLVGDQKAIEAELERHFRIQDLKISIVHASEQIEMDESPTAAIKKKKDSSIAVCTRLHKEGKVDAFVSAGNTGAVMASATFGLGRIPGVSRPAIGTFLPNVDGVTLMIDAGANVDCKPVHLQSFGVMASIFIEKLLGIEKPRVGLLSIGEEPSKGNELTLQTYKLLSNSPVNFIGNVEGRDVLKGGVDVVVCDGFVGNIVLKFAESFNKIFTISLKRNIGKRILANIGAYLLIPAFKRTKQIFDWEEYGGAPLLGIDGVCIICHGKSSPKAIKNAITEAAKIIREKVNETIRAEINSLGAKN